MNAKNRNIYLDVHVNVIVSSFGAMAALQMDDVGVSGRNDGRNGFSSLLHHHENDARTVGGSVS
jgi:hypothetical protein